ncbi:hypothetical protein NDU88_004207 [Pleurodeles waltl]|uniref:Uncharacterized protein n=1 Tax=Pleurodeles waltl TaxID=8319 RepID=A0AAV7V2E3_PLEWA|nr:hypothetical protein NDU88_004207 [Pleurodeles waltl]
MGHATSVGGPHQWNGRPALQESGSSGLKWNEGQIRPLPTAYLTDLEKEVPWERALEVPGCIAKGFPGRQKLLGAQSGLTDLDWRQSPQVRSLSGRSRGSQGSATGRRAGGGVAMVSLEGDCPDCCGLWDAWDLARDLGGLSLVWRSGDRLLPVECGALEVITQ